MSKVMLSVCVVVGAMSLAVCHASADGSAYNDLSWASGQPETAITKYAPSGSTNGLLVSFPSNTAMSVRVGITGAASVGVYPSSIPAGSDADLVFSGKVSCVNGVYWSSGDIVFTFTGMNTSKLYDVVAFSSRGYASASYSNRFTVATLSDVTSFTNSSSVGIEKSTTTMANDTAKCMAGNLSGMIYKYTAINPGSDGDMQIKFTPVATSGYGLNGYLNSFMLAEYAAPSNPLPPATSNDESGLIIYLK